MTAAFDTTQQLFLGAGREVTLDQADLAIFGVGHGTPYLNIDNRVYEGTADALRIALDQEVRWPGHYDFDLGGPLLSEGSFKVADLGNLRTAPLDGPGNRALIRAATEQIVAAGAVPVMLGGDDSVPIPFLEGLAAHGPLTIIQIDAHIDWRQERRGEPLGFSSTMRRASEMEHVERIVHVGTRGIGSARPSDVAEAKAWGAEFVTARQLHAEGVAAVLAHLPEGANCMITVDCDGLDPSIMPAVMGPAPGGLSYMQAIDLVEGVVEKGRLVAFDLMEFVPARDPGGLAAITAARIVSNVIGRVARA